MSNILLVTANPPKIFILVIKIANDAIIVSSRLSDDICINAPIMMILLTAFVTDINGVWSDEVTFQTTIYPTKQERTKTVICERNSDEPPIPIKPTKTAASEHAINLINPLFFLMQNVLNLGKLILLFHNILLLHLFGQ